MRSVMILAEAAAAARPRQHNNF